jgi:hypothetical protein
MTCKNCAYSAVQLAENGKPGGGLICRANPPVPQAVPVPAPGGVSLQVVSLWPIVQPGDICGGFEPPEPEAKPN